ncbi:MAG: sulfotransferase [Pacificimonas sp.]
MNGAPLFLYGFARSGTTLLTMMMGAHEGLSVPLTVAGLWYKTAATAFSDKLAVSAEAERLAAHEKLARWKVDFDLDAITAGVRPGHGEDFLTAFHTQAAGSEGKRRWANMDIATIDHLETAARWFPEARFVHIVRDARDVALSHQGMMFSEGNWFEIALGWSARVGAAERIGNLLGPQRHFTLRFEDLIRHTERELRRICAFADLDFDPAMLRHEERVDGRIPADRRGLWPELNKPPQLNKIDRWTREANDAQIYVVQEFAGPTLRALGYPCPEQQSVSVTGEAFLAQQLLERGHRAMRLRQKLGLKSSKRKGRAA